MKPPAHVRTIRVEAVRTGPDELEVTGTLLDERPHGQALEQLVGLSVARGFNRAVQERFGRQRGCAHLTALIVAMAPVVKQGAGAAFRGERDAPTSPDDLWFINTCQAWRADGPLHSLLKRGDVEGLKAMSARSTTR